MSAMACSLGCFVCGNRGDGPARGNNAHDSGCCKSTRCDSHGWEKQVKKWLKAQKKYETEVSRWLLAELLHTEQCQAWLAAEQQYAVDCEVWLVAQREFRTTLRVKAVKRVRVQAAPVTPQTAKVRAHAR